AGQSPGTTAASAFPNAAKANPSIFYDRQGHARSVSEVYRVLVARYDVARATPAVPASAVAASGAPVAPTTLPPLPPIPAAAPPHARRAPADSGRRRGSGADQSASEFPQHVQRYGSPAGVALRARPVDEQSARRRGADRTGASPGRGARSASRTRRAARSVL